MSARKDGRLASFVLGTGVILVYYVLLYGARAAAMGGRLNPALAPWLPNVVMGIASVALMVWRTRAADAPIRLPRLAWRQARAPSRDAAAKAPVREPASHVSTVRTSSAPLLSLPFVRILDRYVTHEYLRVFLLGLGGLLAVFYISTFLDLADKLFRGAATTATLLEYFFFQTPQFLYFVIPMAVLIAALVTVGTLTKNRELLVMRACGISLYRAALPLLILAAVAGGTLYVMQERVLAPANRQADRLNRIIRGWPPQTTALGRRWIIGQRGDLYHFDFFDPAVTQFSRLRLYHLDQDSWRLKGITYAEEAAATAGGTVRVWTARRGWQREFDRATGSAETSVRYDAFDTRPITLDAPDYFQGDTPDARGDLPDAELMNYRQLEAYIAKLRASGSNVVPYVVALKRKVAFPFVTIIMTLLAVPFAVSTGSRGALYGIGIGIVLALSYWTALSVFGALGAGGVLSPTLAAWAPNLLFGAAALYGNLAVET